MSQEAARLVEGRLSERPGVLFAGRRCGGAQRGKRLVRQIQIKDRLAVRKGCEDRSRDAQRDGSRGESLPLPALWQALEQTRDIQQPDQALPTMLGGVVDA